MYYHFRLDHTPDYRLSPNGQYKSPLANGKLAQKAKELIEPVIATAPSFPEGAVAIRWYVFWEKGHKMMDADNLLRAFKHYSDSVARAIGVDDRHFIPSVEQHRDSTGKGFTLCLISTGEGHD